MGMPTKDAGQLLLRRLDENRAELFEHESIFPNRYLLEQFTGLLDKNGKERQDLRIFGFVDKEDFVGRINKLKGSG